MKLIVICENWPSAIEEAQRDFLSTKDPQRIDIITDRYMFRHMLDIAKEIQNRL